MGAGKRYGFDTYVGIAEEASWAAGATRTKFLEIAGESGGHNPGRTVLNTWRSRAPVGYFDQAIKSLKSYTFPMTYEGLLLILRGALWSINANGTYVGATMSGTVKNHVFKLGATKPKSLVFEGAGTDPSATGATLFQGAYIKKATFDFKASDASSVTVDFVSKGEARTTRSSSPTFAGVALYAKPGTFAIVIDSDTGSSLELDSLQIVVEPGIDDGRAKLKGDANIVEPEPTGKASVTATLARDYNSESMYAKLISGATASISVTSSGGTIAGSSPTTPYSLTVLCNSMVVMGDPPSHKDAGLLGESITLQGQDDAVNSMIKVTVNNLETALT